MQSLSWALLQAPLLTAAFSSSSVLGVSRKFLHPIGKVLWPSFSIRVTHASSAWIGSYLLCRNSIKFYKIPLVVVYVTTPLSIMLVIIRDTRRFRILWRRKMDGLSPWKRVASCVSIRMDWTRLLCSRTVLALGWFNMGGFSPGFLELFKVS